MNKVFRLAGALALGLVAAASAPGYNLMLNPNTGLPRKWPAGPVPFLFMLGDTQTLGDGTTYNSSAQVAANAWNAVIGSVQLQVTVGQPGGASRGNGVNEMLFAGNIFGLEFPLGAVGVTTVGGDGNRITETDITLNSNPNYTWDSYRGAPRQQVEVRRVVLHELGHALGLGHANLGTLAIMNPTSNTNESVQPDDQAGVQALYGRPGTPGNDDFANATLITLGSNNSTVINSFNTNATKQPAEPNHAAASGGSQAPNSGGRSVWWRWTAPANGSASVDTRGSFFDTTLGVYTGTSVLTLTSIASNDDIQAGVIQASEVSFNVTAGTTYRIAVDGFNSDDGHGADCGGIVLNLAFSTSELTAPAITTQPSSVTVTAGESATFSVGATGSAPLRFQWLFNSNPITGATSANYSVNATTSAQAGTYSVTVTNSAGSVTSNGATLTVNAAIPAPTPSPSPSGGGGGGGGGGGAPSPWFCVAGAALGLGRLLRRRG